MDNNNRAIDAQARLAQALLEIVSEACGDEPTRRGLAAMLASGAWLRFSIDVPGWDLTADLVRGDTPTRLFSIRPRMHS